METFLRMKTAVIFRPGQHEIGDDAFKTSNKIVPNYKKPQANLPQNWEYEHCHISLRISSEQILERLKHKFQRLHDRMVSIHNKKTHKLVLRLIVSRYVLHNIALNREDLRYIKTTPSPLMHVGYQKDSDEDYFDELDDSTLWK